MVRTFSRSSFSLHNVQLRLRYELFCEIQLGGLWERCKLLQQGLGRSPSRNRIWCILTLKSDIWWQHFRIAHTEGVQPLGVMSRGVCSYNRSVHPLEGVNKSLPQSGRGQGHVTSFLSFGTPPYITSEHFIFLCWISYGKYYIMDDE